MARTGLYIGGSLAAGIYAVSFLGSEYVSPFLALCITWLTAEHRTLCLESGVVVMRGIIWILVIQLLDRALP